MELSLDQRINEVLDLLDEGVRKLTEMAEAIEIQGWEEICEAKELLEQIPFGLMSADDSEEPTDS